MISNINVRISAGHVNLPLPPSAVFKDSAASVTIEGVPNAQNGLAVTGVNLAVTNAAGTTLTVAAKAVGKAWTATVAESHFAAAGSAKSGLAVYAVGTDENGTARNWCLGRGDVYILATDSASVNLGEYTNTRLLDAEPDTPHKGDLCLIDSTWKLYNGTAWIAFGGGTGVLTHSLTAGAKSFDGSEDITITASDLGAATTEDIPTDAEIAAIAKATKVDNATSADEAGSIYSSNRTTSVTASDTEARINITRGGTVTKVANIGETFYTLGTTTSDILPNGVAYLALDSSQTTLTIAPPTSLYGCTDFVIYINPAADVTISYSPDANWYATDADDIKTASASDGKITVIYVSEMTRDENGESTFAVSKAELEAVTTTTTTEA